MITQNTAKYPFQDSTKFRQNQVVTERGHTRSYRPPVTDELTYALHKTTSSQTKSQFNQAQAKWMNKEFHINCGA